MGRTKGSKNKLKLSDSNILEIIRLYKDERMPLYKIETMFSIGRETLKNLLRENGIELRNFRESKRIYPLNEDYFNIIDSLDKAYWLGFMYADGYISKGNNGQFLFGLKLHEKEPIELFKKYLNTEKPIGEYIVNHGFNPGSTEYSLIISSQKIFNALQKHGCVENKTFKLKFPKTVSPELIPHFIRGYFDGDGSNSVGYTDLGNLYISSSFMGTKTFLESLMEQFSFIKKDHTILYKEKRTDSDCYYIKLGSNYDSLSLYHYMYKNCGNLFLKRKRDKFEFFILDKGSTTIITNPTKETYLDLCYLEG